ncbi:MAG: hypothetical protein J6X51_00690 [Bacteroidales bacterium]|nr:hypothetical protein [Bacteroidales bacterium]
MKRSFITYSIWKRMALLLWLVLPMFLSAQKETFKFDSFCPSAPVVKDHEGNTYRTVQIGTQCWMAENMRCRTSPTGVRWRLNPQYTASQPEYAAYYATPTDTRHGLLYNWTAAMDMTAHQNSSRSSIYPVRGICPSGWHLPNNEEWSQLFKTLGGNHIAGEAMRAPTQMWEPYYSVDCSKTGFDATPAGAYTENGYQYASFQTYFWSSDNFSRNQAWCCIIYDFKNESYNYLDYKCYGHSVRCVKDN